MNAPEPDRIRLPVQTGQSGLRLATGAFCVMFPAAAFCALAGAPGFLITVSIGLPFLLFGLAASIGAATQKNRASDLILDERGIRLDGGPPGIRFVAWSEIDRPRCSVEASAMLFWKLHLGLRRGGTVVIATAGPTDKECLTAVCDTLRAGRWGNVDAGATPSAPEALPPPALLTRLWQCSGCGVALAPVEAPETDCPRCGERSAVPDEIRERIRAVHVVSGERRRVEALTARVLRHPRARAVNVVLRATGWIIAALIPLVWFVNSASFAVFVVALLIALLCVTQVYVADRTAVRHLTLHAAARGPRSAGEAYGCRNCGAPLEATGAGAGVISRCVYCEADNVLGLDLRREASGPNPERFAIERALARRHDERQTGSSRFVVSAGISAVGLWLWIPSIGARANVSPPVTGEMTRSPEEVMHERNLALYGQACDKGDASGCTSLGRMYEEGNGVTMDQVRAAALFGRACDGGDGYGCSYLGSMYEGGRGVARNEARAVVLHERACEQRAFTCNTLGVMYEKGTGVVRDEARALALYKKACNAGSASGCANVDVLARSACDPRGDPSGCNDLGVMYEKGTGVARDETRAVALYRQACDGGAAGGCSNLGWMYQDGLGVAKDEARAVRLYTRACDDGLAAGCSNLGELYAEGRVVVRDEAKAVVLFYKGCVEDTDAGCFDLGLMFESGVGVTPDRVRAAGLYEKGCKAGNQWNCNRLKRMGTSPQEPGDVTPASHPARPPGPSPAPG